MLYLSYCHEICRCKSSSKKDDKTDQENYQPISILPNLGKIYKRIMYNQICPYFSTMFSNFQCGFCKGFNAQYRLLLVIEKKLEVLDINGVTGAVLRDLSKAFGCINDNLLIAKLHAYSVEKSSLYFIHSYLTKRNQRTKIESVV